MDNYFYIKEGKRVGPVTLEELSRERITRKTLIWTNGMDEWIEAVKVEGLQYMFSTEPPPIPTESGIDRDKSLPFKGSGKLNSSNIGISANKKKIAVELKYFLYSLGLALVASALFLWLSHLYQDYTFETYERGKTFPNKGPHRIAIAITQWGTIFVFFGILLFRPIRYVVNWIKLNSK
jgi:hypothetical protein